MSDLTARLALPVIAPSQAQKHVTHNEALQRLDLLVQMRIAEFGAITPPPVPEPGALHALGTGAQGVWAGQDGKLAAFLDGAWIFLDPQPGWVAAEPETGMFRIYRDGIWRAAPERLSRLGLGTAPDLNHRLSVAARGTLLSHAGGDHRLTINKASDADTASLLFQSGFSGRAEIGLTGENGFHLKVSHDGTTWTDALRVDPVTGMASGQAIQGSPIDSTAERLMTVGAFGLGAGAIPISTNWDAVEHTGWYTDGVNVSIGEPAGFSNMAMMNVAVNSGAGTQVAVHSNRNSPQLFVRSKSNGTWGDWSEIFTTASVESQTNSNGSYIRYPNGTQICTFVAPAVNTAVAAGALFQEGRAFAWNFPASFVSQPSVSGTGGQTARWLAIAEPSLSAVGYRVFSYLNNSSLGQPSLMAIGRWF